MKKTSFLTESQTGHGKEVIKNNNDNDSDNNNDIMKNIRKRRGSFKSIYGLYSYIESASQNNSISSKHVDFEKSPEQFGDRL